MSELKLRDDCSEMEIEIERKKMGLGKKFKKSTLEKIVTNAAYGAKAQEKKEGWL
jgi:hypothetical protein